MKRILGIDPGGRTGIAIIEGPTRQEPGYNLVKVDQFTEEFYLHVMKDLILDEVLGRLDQIVIEDFVARPDKSRFEYIPLPVPKQIGQVEAFGYLAKIPVFISSPSNKPAAYGFAFNGKPKYKKGAPDRHMLDAVSHAVFWLVTKGI